MVADRNQKSNSPTRPQLGRHESGCRICAHPQRQAIERDFISWRSPAKIALAYGLRDRSSVYRHAHALNLFSKRARNVRAALERIIEKVDEVNVNAGAVVQAIIAYAKINARGNFIERHDLIDLNDLFERMSREELETYARDGSIPEWFSRQLGATGPHGPGGSENA